MALKPRRFRHKGVDWIGAFCALVIAAAAFWFGVKPVLLSGTDVRRLTGQVTSSQKQLEEARVAHRELQQAAADARRRLDAMAIELDTSDQLASRQAGIGRVFRDTQVNVEQFSVGTVEKGEHLDVVPLRINGKGTSPDVIAAMHTLRQRFPDVAIRSFQISLGGRDSDQKQQVLFGFDLAWYIASDGTPES